MTGNKTIEKCFEEAEETGLLYLSSKGLRDFPDVASDCELIDVIEADLSRNRFAEFPVEICDFVMLERLDLYHNAIRSIPELHPHLKWLTMLNLRRNQVCSLPISIGRLPLRVLNLSNNKLTTLPVEIGYLTLLQDLDLSSNELSRLPSTMGEMISLKELNVRRNQLQVLPDELSKLKLVKLDFSCNKVSVIPPAYRLITTLSCLELSHNPLISPPAHVCIKGRQHIFKYLSVVAQQDKKRTFDRDVRKFPYTRKGSSLSLKDEYFHGIDVDPLSNEKVKRTLSLDMSGVGISYNKRQSEEKDVYRPSSLRERDKHRVPLSNVFETEEKRREIQKEIERAQRLLSESIDQQEAGSQPDEEIDEGEELEKEFLSIEMEQRKKKEEEERLIEERRRAARKLHRDQQEIIQQQKTDPRRRTLDNGYERRRSGAMSGLSKPDIPPRPTTLERKPSNSTVKKPRSSSFQGTGSRNTTGSYHSKQEEDMKAREALMQQSRREAQLSRQRHEEERQRSQKKKDTTLTRDNLNQKSNVEKEARFSEADCKENIFHNIHKRPNKGSVRSLPASLKNKEDPNFTIKRMYDSAREEFEKIEILREALESRLKVTLPDDLPASLADGVVLCHLINLVCKGTIPSIHIPSAGVPKLTMTKCQKNVDSFLEGCRKLGVKKEDLCTASDILEEKSPQRVCLTVQALLKKTDRS